MYIDNPWTEASAYSDCISAIIPTAYILRDKVDTSRKTDAQKCFFLQKSVFW